MMTWKKVGEKEENVLRVMEGNENIETKQEENKDGGNHYMRGKSTRSKRKPKKKDELTKETRE